MSKKHIVLFDMDGTLTPPREEFDKRLFHPLRELSKHAELGIVTGSDIDYLSTQMKMLIKYSELRHVIRRAFIIEKFPYSEIQDNTISEKTIPIDMLRLKLSFFGALKFDPRSDKWLRICMFQGAPLPHELKKYDEQWVYKYHS